VEATTETIEHGTFNLATVRPDELATQVKLDVSDLPPYGTQAVWAAISIPPQAVAGERYAVIRAQIAAPTWPAGGVRMVSRADMRVYLDVGPGGGAAAGGICIPKASRCSASKQPSGISG
jgi:hypothetical protein